MCVPTGFVTNAVRDYNAHVRMPLFTLSVLTCTRVHVRVDRRARTPKNGVPCETERRRPRLQRTKPSDGMPSKQRDTQCPAVRFGRAWALEGGPQAVQTGPGGSLTEKKKSVPVPVFPKKPAGTPCAQPWLVAVGGGWRLAVGGGWRLAVGNWRLVAVGGGWRRLVAGGWWLEAVGSGWQLAVGRRWRLAAVGGWRLVAVGGWRLVAVGS